MSARSLGNIVGRQLATATGKSDTRRKLIMAVRAAARRLRLGDDDRKAIQIEVTGKESMSDMDAAEIGRVLDRLNRDQTGSYGNRPDLHRTPWLGKVRALWWTCFWLGLIDQPGDGALAAFVKRQTGIDALRFLDHRSAPAVIEALKAMAARAGVDWPSDGPDKAKADRIAVLRAMWQALFDLNVIGPISLEKSICLAERKRVDDGFRLTDLSGKSLDDHIRSIGKQLRRTKARADRASD